MISYNTTYVIRLSQFVGAVSEEAVPLEVAEAIVSVMATNLRLVLHLQGLHVGGSRRTIHTKY